MIYAGTSIIDLRVQNMEEPITVEDRHPLFSWKMHSDIAGQAQKAYQLIVKRESDNMIVWNTGKVQSGISVNIKYLGVALQPETGYSWELTVWDINDQAYVSSSRFETGLMNPKISAWEGAEFIGSTAPRLDAASHYYFEILTGFQLMEGEKISLILGANDFRLKDSFQNPQNIEGEHYIRVELDLSGVGHQDGAELKVYRVAYSPDDKPDVPLVHISNKTFPKHNLNEIFTSANKYSPHTLAIYVETSNIYFVIDGKDVQSEPVEYKEFRSGFAVGSSTLKVRNSTRFPIGVWGNTHDYNTSPNLCSVGFAATPHSKVIYTDYQIKNCGYSEDKVVFDDRNYCIFKNLSDCVHVDSDKIIVDNEGIDMEIAYADPSHGALPMLRSEFLSQTGIKSAKLYVTAMGGYEMFINGERVGDAWFAPGDSQFREFLGYHAYDVTSLIKEGNNSIAAQLFPAWYTGYMTFMTNNFNFFGDYEALLLKLVITYESGKRQVITSNPDSWKAFNDGPIRYGSFFNGERYDANKESLVEGWKSAGFNDASWTNAQKIQPRSWIDFAICARYDEPVKIRERIKAKRLMPTHSKDKHTYIYDMGVNMVGVPYISIPAGWLHKGDTVIIRYSEQLYPGLKDDISTYRLKFGPQGRNIAGRPLFENLRAALCTDFYIAKDDAATVISPTTTYRGYQYVQITLPAHKGALPIENIEGLVLSSDRQSGSFYKATTADNNKTALLVNRLFKNIQRSQLGNFFTIPTDCPQRNERMGWTGDAQAYVGTASYISDVLNFFRQWMVSLRADQGIGGAIDIPGGIGSTVPTYNQKDDASFADGTTWAAAVCMVPWQLYKQYGNTQVIEENMEAMMDWLNGMDFYDYSEKFTHLSGKTTGLGDWLAMDERTPSDLVNNAIYIYTMEITAKMAEAIGCMDYASLLRKRYTHAKEEWNKLYVDPVTGKTRNSKGEIVHSQSSYATPLKFNCFDEKYKMKAEAYLAELSVNPSASGAGHQKFPAYTITTGFSGTPNILLALSCGGYVEIAYSLFTSTELPSWLYPVTKGATSIWERWNGYEAAFGDKNENHMNSFNHFALGAVGQWMYEYQLGIVPGSAGYKNFILQPNAGGNYTSLSGCYESAYGQIYCSWTADGKGKMNTLHVKVPANTTATLYLPVSNEITEFSSIDGVEYKGKTLHLNRSVMEFYLQSGDYKFKVDRNRVLVGHGITD